MILTQPLRWAPCFYACRLCLGRISMKCNPHSSKSLPSLDILFYALESEHVCPLLPYQNKASEPSINQYHYFQRMASIMSFCSHACSNRIKSNRIDRWHYDSFRSALVVVLESCNNSPVSPYNRIDLLLVNTAVSRYSTAKPLAGQGVWHLQRGSCWAKCVICSTCRISWFYPFCADIIYFGRMSLANLSFSFHASGFGWQILFKVLYNVFMVDTFL